MEANIVVEYDVFPQCLWPRYFIKEQGYAVEKQDLHQDNMSDIIMEDIETYSRTKRKNHI